MNKLYIYIFIMIASVTIASFSQILLKKSARKQYANRLEEYLNPLVITAYFLFFGSAFLTMFALKEVPLSMAPILEATGYFFIPILSFIFLQEKLTKRQLIGTFVIVLGIVIFCS